MSYKRRKVLITGGLGFLGSNLAHALLREGAEVTCMDALLPAYGGNPFNVDSIREDIRIEIADIRDKGAVARLAAGQDVVFHIAAQTSHVDSMADPFLDVDINLNGTLNILETLKQSNRDARIVYAGTRAQYGKMQSDRVTETDLPNPTDVYGVNKLAAEYHMMIYSRIYGMPAVSLRMTNAYGPRHQMKSAKYGILNWFIRLALDDAALPVYGDGRQLRDYLYVDDAVRGLLLAGRPGSSAGGVLNLGGNQPVSFVDMVRAVARIAGSGRIEFVEWPRDRQAIETGDFATDPSRILSVLGWKPETDLETGLNRTIEFYREHKSHYW